MNPHFLEAPSFDRQRERFLSAARMANASLTEWLHPLKGPREETLITDVAVVGDPHARSRLVVLSGTHGIEGFYGSDCQIALLESLRTHGVPDGVSVVIIHLVNPWVRQNVLPRLPNYADPAWKTRLGIQNDLIEFLAGGGMRFER